MLPGLYFAALRIPPESRRLFTDEDRQRAAGGGDREPGDGAAILGGRQSDRAADRAGEGPRTATLTVIGVVGNVRPPFQIGDVAQVYVSYRQQRPHDDRPWPRKALRPRHTIFGS